MIVGFIISRSDDPYLVGCSREMLLNDRSIVVGVAFVYFKSLSAECTNVTAFSSPNAFSDRDDLEVEAPVLVQLTSFNVSTIGAAFGHHMERSLTTQTFKETESMISSDMESLILMSVEIVQDKLMAVEEVGGYFSDFGDVQDRDEFVGSVGVGQKVVVCVFVLMVGEALETIGGYSGCPNH